MEDVDPALEALIETLVTLPTVTRKESETMMEVYVCILTYLRLAVVGDLELFLIYEILDDALQRLLAIISSHAWFSDGPNPRGLCPQSTSSNRLKRSLWMLCRISGSTVPDEFKTFAQHAFHVQVLLSAELSASPASFEDSTCTNRKSMIETMLKIIDSLKGSKGSWMSAFDYVMENHFLHLHQVYYLKAFSRTVPPDLMISLTKLGVVFDSDDINLQLNLMTRELIFRTLSAKVETVLDYMKERKSTAMIGSVDRKLFAYLSSSALGIKLFTYVGIIERKFISCWNAEKDGEEKKQLALFGFGLRVVANLLAILNKHQPTDLLASEHFSSLGTISQSILLEATSPIISAAFQGSVRKVLEISRELKGGRYVKASSIEAAFSVVEAELALLHKTKREKAILLYHYLVLCRGINALWINSFLSTPNVGSPQEKEVVESKLMMLMGLSTSLMIYDETRDFLLLRLSKLSSLNFDLAHLQRQMDFIHDFRELFYMHTVPKGVGQDFLTFVAKRMKEHPSHPLYLPLKGKIKSSMLKSQESVDAPARPVKKIQQSSKKPKKHRSRPAKPVNVAGPSVCEPDCKALEKKEDLNPIDTLTEKEKNAPKETPATQETSSSALAVVPSKPRNSRVASSELAKPLASPLKRVKTLSSAVMGEVFSRPVEVLNLSGHFRDSRKDNVWANTFQRLMPTFDGHLRPIQIKQPKPKAITSRVIDKFEEPTHYSAIAKSLGFVEGNIDPRDYLMALVLIGERLLKRKFEPMLAVFQRKQSTDYLSEMFYKSIDSFEKEILMVSQFDPDFLKPALKQAGLDTSADLLSCIKYYKLRIAACHPYVPKSTFLKKNITARHLTSLDVLQTYDPSMMLRMRHYLECYDEVFVRSIETGTDRPKVLYSPQCTDKVLATIGLFEIFPLEDIRMDRNEAAHKNTTDSKYAAYIQYVFGDSPDCEFLAKI